MFAIDDQLFYGNVLVDINNDQLNHGNYQFSCHFMLTCSKGQVRLKCSLSQVHNTKYRDLK